MTRSQSGSRFPEDSHKALASVPLCSIQLNFINTDSDNTDSRFTRTNFFGPARSPWFYIPPLMDNTDSANADFRLTQTTFSTRCHQNTSVNMDCVAVWTLELQPIGCQLFTHGSYYNYAGHSNGRYDDTPYRPHSCRDQS